MYEMLKGGIGKGFSQLPIYCIENVKGRQTVVVLCTKGKGDYIRRLNTQTHVHTHTTNE